MSKINAIRIINLNYNKNTMKINDEIFEFAGESTLMSLRNGGGKSVIVQMIMAPFVNARYRDLKNRKFESYFMSSTPTYILTEWILDNNSSHVLVGMGIKRRDASLEEDSLSNLEIFTFIHEYKQGNKYDIHSFPVTEKAERGFKIKPFSYIKNIMDVVKIDKQYIFDYFDLNVDPQRRKYFDKLKQYNINHREWESIIKRINLKESGLSDLFQDARTVSGLVEKWFLPTIEEKLNDKDDKIKNFREIMKKFIYQYKENENKILRRNGIEDFKIFSSRILKSAEEFKSVKVNTECIKNDIANLFIYIESQIKKLSDEKAALELKLSILNEELNEIEYEKLSIDYYELDEKMKNLLEEEKKLQMIIQEYEDDIKNIEMEIGIQECAKLYQQYKEASKNVQQYENMLNIAKSKDKEKQYERNNLGFTLRKLFQDIVEKRKNEISIKTDEEFAKKKLIKDIKEKIEQLNTQITLLTGEISSLKSNILFYNKEENNFIKKYNQSLKRNIVGEYDEVLLDLHKRDFVDKNNKVNREYAEMLKEQDSAEQELIKKRKELDDKKTSIFQLDYMLKDTKRDLETINNAVDEIGKIILYSSLEESKIFDKEYLMKQLNKKIESLKADKIVLTKELYNLEKEKKMYETGRNVRLSKEIEERLEELNIYIVFGLEWLKKQELTNEKKEELIKNNPFLPYSLIMSRDNLDKLKMEEARLYTSFPVPIVEQERIEDNLDVKIANNVYTLGNVNFFISFNNRILNEKELRKLLSDLNCKIEKANEFLKNKDHEIDIYTNHKKKVEEFNIRKVDIENKEEMISKIQCDTADLRNKMSLLIDNVQSLEENRKKLNKTIKDLEKRISYLENEKEDFYNLMEEYEKYIKYNKELILKTEELRKVSCDKNNIVMTLSNEVMMLSEINEQITNLKIKLNDADKKAQQYINFKEGNFIDKDVEDIEAKYIALTQGIGLEVKQLEDVLNEFSKNFKSFEDELIKKSDEYGFKESQYSVISYDEIKLKSLKQQKFEYEKEHTKKNKEFNNIQMSRTKIETEQKYKLNDIYSIGKQVPKDRIYISNLDFTMRKKIKEKEINDCNESIYERRNYISNLCTNQNKMNEYADFIVVEEKIVEYQYNQIEEIREELKKSYMESIKLEKEKGNALSDYCQDLLREDKFFHDEFFKNTIDTLFNIKNNPEDVIKTLETVKEVHAMMLKQLEADLSKVEEEKKNIIDMFHEYVEQVHEHISRIDDNSSININGRYIKMLNIIIPNWEEREEQYKLLSRDYVENLTKSCLDVLLEGKNIEEILSMEITTKKLYDYIVGINEIDIKLYKIEASKQIQINWNQVSENSGGEGFLSAFVILTSLLSYMRKEESDIFKAAQESKVIIMDNPFAQTNAEHLLKPLMEIAKKNNTQLICFSGLGGDSIYNRFDNIYVLNLVDSKLKAGLQFIESEHKKGEEITHMSSSRFRIKKEKLEQIKLF